ncbi:enoyl-CoA hydratase/isomerase family protein [Piscinibacter sakaiensis]|uniref:Enoyl-CoA hydratase n=1 Tax=Piscinibacter sakaiensis TaxID=1547922 RepID=A0A0K8P5X3_PISS1|nr:enoyl-CoA hydratase-related protein [Piscinibacter sakaiensis]GAP37924.1 enoyl-CoA hydratase [Piscinibacter sakaiensis]
MAGTDGFDYRHLDVRVEGEVARATLNRPGSLNALDTLLVTELRDFFSRLASRPDIRAVVLGGAGRAFCAGADLKERPLGEAARSVADVLAQQRSIRDVMLAMRRCPQPIVAIVQGAASGGGFALALAADVRLATPDARMNAAFIRIGLSACDVGVSYFLPRMVGSSVASELMLTGRFLDAQRALVLGLVSRVAPLDELRVEAESMVADMLLASPLGLRLTKDALGLSLDAGSMETVIAMEDRNQVLCAVTEDFREAKAAFVEKRAPRYRNR